MPARTLDRLPVIMSDILSVRKSDRPPVTNVRYFAIENVRANANENVRWNTKYNVRQVQQMSGIVSCAEVV